MNKNLKIILSLTLCTLPFLSLKPVYANTVLREAVIQKIENRVRLIPQNQPARLARTSDRMTPGDSLATAAQSKAEIRFNEGSLARLGEKAVFQFNRGTRTVDLRNGTALFLIPRGQGTTQIRTPNAAAGIRGSALFVRVSPDDDTTIIGALTNSDITVINEDGSEGVTLKGGQLAHFAGNQLQGIYDFDLTAFLETSSLVNDLNLTTIDPTTGENDPLNVVRSEIIEAVESQEPFSSQDTVIENPDFINLDDSSLEEFPNPDVEVVDLDVFGDDMEKTIAILRNNGNIRGLTEAGEMQAQQNLNNNFPGSSNGGSSVGVATGDFGGVGATASADGNGRPQTTGLERALEAITGNNSDRDTQGQNSVTNNLNRR